MASERLNYAWVGDGTGQFTLNCLRSVEQVDHYTEAYGMLRSKPKPHEVKERNWPSLWPLLGPAGVLYESYRKMDALQYAQNGHYDPQAPLSKEMTDQFIQYVNTGLAHEPR